MDTDQSEPTPGEQYDLRAGTLAEKDRRYWFAELRIRRLTLGQIETLLETPGVHFHEVCALIDRGCPVDVAFDIFS